MTAVDDALIALAALSPTAEIIITLQAFTSRDLTQFPPASADKLGDNLGIGDTNLDRFIRPWINKRFLARAGKTLLPPGAVTGKTTFKELCTMAGVQ